MYITHKNQFQAVVLLVVGEGAAEVKVSDVGPEASLLDTAQHTVQAGALQSPL